jgi:hypothetical protein
MKKTRLEIKLHNKFTPENMLTHIKFIEYLSGEMSGNNSSLLQYCMKH